MGLLGIDLSEGASALAKNLLSPFARFLAEPPDLKGAQERNDFREGFVITPFVDGKVQTRDVLALVGNMMPHQPFEFGGKQQISKQYYPGNSEPTVHILGPRENNITIRGEFHAKKIGKDFNKNKREEFRQFATEIQQQLDAIRIAGNLVRITMGEFRRFGFIEEGQFSMKTLAKVGYEITFFIIGFNPPSDCKVIDRSKEIPFDIQKNLVAAVIAFEAQRDIIPPAIPRSLADQIKDAISDVAEAVNLVTDFVDVVLNEVADISSAISRAEGLIKNARAKISELQRTRIGNISPFAVDTRSAGRGIGDSYNNADYIQETLRQAFSLTAFLESLREQLAEIAKTEPLARHRVQTGDTLQKIALRFYNDATLWDEIFEHNKLKTTTLTLGEILEIPRAT